jgi:energy-coupling factor transporter transmembrane protein EcfT
VGRSRNNRRYSPSPEQIKREMANRKRLINIYGFLIVIVAFVLSGGVFTGLRIFFATELYHAFIYDWIGTALLYLAGLTLLLYFIYGSLVITIKNPQKIKKKQVFSWGGIGIICLALGGFIFHELSSITINSVRDMKDYSNGVMKIEELKVVDVYTGGHSEIALIETEEQELSLLLNGYRIEEGQTYRFTYLERTGTILNVE